MKFIIGVFLLFTAVADTHAQRVCGAAGYAKNTVLAKQQFLSEALRDTAANEVINIPVVVHVLYKGQEQNISDAQIKSQIDALNRDYRRQNADAINTPDVFKIFSADTRINFCLARVDPAGHITSGIVRKYTSNNYFQEDDAMKSGNTGGDNAWNSKLYLNIWVCSLFGRSLGYSSLPGGPADKDGVVIGYDVFGTVEKVRAPFDKGRTATHEIGHWLGLKHIWGDDDCASDGVDDTPTQESYNVNCPKFPRISSCSPNSNGDMFMNYMDLTNDGCMNMFTTGQKNKMRALFAQGGYRNSFLNAFACDSTKGTAAGPLPEVPVEVVKDTAVVPKVVDPILVFPNPATSFLNIQCKKELTLFGKMARLYSMTGKLVQQQLMKGTAVKIDVSGLPAGMYLLQVGDGKERQLFKIVKL